MKRILSLLLSIALVLTFAACGDKADVSSDQSFTKPENYSTVLLVTINPEFRLYLDEQDNVLAVEPVNDDAKSVVKDSKISGKLETVIDEIVNKTSDAGFVKENATFNLQIIETKKEHTNAENILNTAKDTANKAFEKIDVTVEIKTSISENVSNNSDTQNTTPDADTSEPTDKNDTNSNESTITPTHTHSFSKATCTAPKTCACGATQGNPLGHTFKDGKCSVCGANDPSHVTVLTPLSTKNGKWTVEYINNEIYYTAKLTLVGELYVGIGIGDPISKMEPEIQDDIRANKDHPDYKESYVLYNGKEYWCGRGSGSPLATMTENGNTVTLTSSDDSTAQIVLTRTAENTLTVKSCTQTFKEMVEDIPVGTKFTFKAN